MKKIQKSLLSFGLLAGVYFLAGSFLPPVMAQSYVPSSYYTFDQSNSLKDEMNKGDLNPSYFGGTYQINTTGGAVSKFFTMAGGTNYILAAGLPLNTEFSTEFLFRASSSFQGCDLFSRWDNAVSASIGYPYISFNVKIVKGNTTTNENFTIDLDGLGRKQYGYYVDSKWHHMVFKANLSTGKMEVWVDGQLPAGFSKTTSVTGTFPQANSLGTVMVLNTNTAEQKFLGDIDEIAFYSTALHPNMIYKHFMEFNSGSHFTSTWSTTPPPVAAAVTGPIDMDEYPAGHPTPTASVIDQLKNYPAPRFKKSHTLMPNISLVDNVYLGGRFQPGVSDQQAIANSVVIQKELATNYNFSVIVAGNTGGFADFTNPSSFNGAWVKLANDNPNFKTAALSFWPHIKPNDAGFSATGSYVKCACLADNNYMKNSNGQYLDLWGNVTTFKWLSPIATDFNSLKNDGLTQRFYLDKLTKAMTRPLNHIFENGENVPYYLPSFQGALKDPNVIAAKNSSGLDWYTFLSKKYTGFAKNYRDQFMTLPALANTNFTYYEIDGHDTFRQKYSEARTISTPISGMNYPSGDLYVRWPWNWRYQVSAWNGLQWLLEARYEELKQGDKYFSPAVSAGWEANEEINIRPGQWLGLLKTFGMMGAEYYYPAYFVLQAPWPNPANYAWHVAMPAYAQGTTSFYEDMFRNGSLMDGDLLANPENPASGPAYIFNTGDYRKIVVARKHNTSKKYAITGTIQNNSNMKGNAELSGPVSFTLDGKQMKINIRRQGSTYVYDNTNSASPVFYQIDGWHESKHPSKWSNDIAIESELFENTTTQVTRKTERPVAAGSGDFTDFTTYTTFASAGNKVEYNFTTRGSSAATYYFWVRARSKSGTSVGMEIKVDGSVKNMDCIVKKSWDWYRIGTNTNPVSFTSLAVGKHLLTLTVNNSGLEIDQILLTSSNAAIYGAGNTNCNGPNVVANITPSGPTDICEGSSVILTASTGTSYLWSTGAITKSITVNQAGFYNVTVYDNGGMGVSTPTEVTIKPAPDATLNANGPTTFCKGASVKFSTAGTDSYLWSPVLTSGLSLTVSKSGNYYFTATASNGCTKKSVTQIVNVLDNCNSNCIVPFGLSAPSKTDNYARIRWDNSLTSANYIIEVTDLSNNTTNTFNIGPYHSLKLYNLLPLHTYQYRVKSVCGNTSSAFSANAFFTTNGQKGGLDPFGNDNDQQSAYFDYQLNGTDDMYKVMAYPNPASDIVNFAFISDKSVYRTLEIFDGQGKLVLSQEYLVDEGFNTITLNCAILTKGVYLVRLFNEKESHSTKLNIK